jgi:hypothetical protein
LDNQAEPQGGLRTGNLSDGYLAVWSLPGPDDPNSLAVAWQTSADPTAAWSAWDQFRFAVQQVEGLNIAVHVCAGQTQLWMVTDENVLEGLPLNSTLPSSGAGALENPFVPNPGPVQAVAVTALADGTCHIFVMTAADAKGSAQILTSHQTSPAAATFTPWVTLGTIS